MKKFSALFLILASLFLLACSSGAFPDGREETITSSSSKAQTAESFGAPGPPAEDAVSGFAFGEREAAAAPMAPPAPAMEGDDGSGVASRLLQTAQRQVISVASVSIEVEMVSTSVDQVRAIAENLGGFVEQLSSTGGSEREQANMTIRVPQEEFFNALERIEDLGEVQNRNVGSEDVSEEFIDLKARLESSQREEESLLALLERANNVTEILTIERELTRIRSEIERVQGRLNFLERRVALATITVSLFPPREDTPQPPSASLVIVTSDVADRVEDIKGLVANLNGKLDRVFLSTRQGQDRADIALRVLSTDFDQATQFIESQGDLRSKELHEGTPADSATPSDEPDARIELSLVEKEGSRIWILWAIVVPIGVILLVTGVSVGIFLAYRAGRRRGSFV
ncbi:MAG: DUF4349 domain-containing protein [Dehalococcoidia bacterium]